MREGGLQVEHDRDAVSNYRMQRRVREMCKLVNNPVLFGGDACALVGYIDSTC
jgi:hypothetical protein